jgi:hypothetical protein
MLFGYWQEHGYDSLPMDHRNLPATYPNTTADPNDYLDARGIVASWAHKQAGMSPHPALTYGSWEYHVPNSIADFIHTRDGSTSRSTIAHGLQTFGAWDNPSTTTRIESHNFTATTNYTSSGWGFAGYAAEIDAGRPVHLGLTATSLGHSVLGIGYDGGTGDKQQIVVLTTWHQGPQVWDWSNSTGTNPYQLVVYAGTTLQPVAGPPPELSAYLSIAHTAIVDLHVEIGIGDPDHPTWSKQDVWNHGGGLDDNLALTDIDLTGALSLFQAGPLRWYLKVQDVDPGDSGTIQDFQVRYGPNYEEVFKYGGPAVPIPDGSGAPAYALLDTIPVPEPCALVLLMVGMACLLLWRRR